MVLMKSRHPFRRAYVFLTLLVVVVIFTIVGGRIIFNSQFSHNHSPSVHARNTAFSLATAIRNFRTQYGSFPYPAGIRTEKFKSDASFMLNLSGKDLTLNKLGLNFVDSIPITKSFGTARSLYYGSESPDLIDPWGNFFIIHLDHDRDGYITNPEADSNSGGLPETLKLKVGVISAGADKMFTGQNQDGCDATKDNIRSW